MSYKNYLKLIKFNKHFGKVLLLFIFAISVMKSNDFVITLVHAELIATDNSNYTENENTIRSYEGFRLGSADVEEFLKFPDSAIVFQHHPIEDDNDSTANIFNGPNDNFVSNTITNGDSNNNTAEVCRCWDAMFDSIVSILIVIDCN